MLLLGRGFVLAIAYLLAESLDPLQGMLIGQSTN